jgi:hypothetical protein
MPEEIPDHVRVFRCVDAEEGILIEADGSTRPKSSAFSDHRLDGAMSVYLEDEMLADGKTPQDLLDLWPGYRLCYHTVGEYRELGQVIVRQPHGSFPGHANVTDGSGRRSASRRTKLAKSARWLDLE